MLENQQSVSYRLKQNIPRILEDMNLPLFLFPPHLLKHQKRNSKQQNRVSNP